MSGNEMITNPLQCDDEKWQLPVKPTRPRETHAIYGNYVIRIKSGFQEAGRKGVVNANWLKDFFKKLEAVLTKGPHKTLLMKEQGFAYPDTESDKDERINFDQLCNKDEVDSFVAEISDFGTMENFKLWYLLGYVGSGKSTLLNFILNSQHDKFELEGVIPVAFEYKNISRKVYSSGIKDDEWIDLTEQMIFNGIYNTFLDLHPQADMQSKENVKEFVLRNVIRKHKVLIVLDGFDSLSANRSEKANAKQILKSILSAIDTIKASALDARAALGQCHVVISLRKCTFYGIDELTQERFDESRVYFLHKCNFYDVIDRAMDSLPSTEFLGDNSEVIKKIIFTSAGRIIRTLSSKKFEGEVDDYSFLEEMTKDENPFDDNYRRLLRLISNFISFAAVRLSNSFTFSTDEANVQARFLNELYDLIATELKPHVVIDILVYGLNYTFNNHFDDGKKDDNLGNYCGFVDNIFGYFESENEKFLHKLRALQILYRHTAEPRRGEKVHLSVDQVRSELKKIRIDVDRDETASILDTLEKSLFIRSYKRRGESSEKMGYRCLNFGSILLTKILPSYTYIAAICQNTVLPASIAKQMRYVVRSSNEPGMRFVIDPAWVENIIPSVIQFLRFLKYYESKNTYDAEYHTADLMAKACFESMNRIVLSAHTNLSEDTRKTLLKSIAEFYSAGGERTGELRQARSSVS